MDKFCYCGKEIKGLPTVYNCECGWVWAYDYKHQKWDSIHKRYQINKDNVFNATDEPIPISDEFRAMYNKLNTLNSWISVSNHPEIIKLVEEMTKGKK